MVKKDSTSNFRVVVLTSEKPSNIWLVNQLLGRHQVVGMIIERRPLALTREEKIGRRRRMIQRYGFLRTVNKLLYNWIRWRFLVPFEEATMRENFFPDGAPVTYTREVPTLVVTNINDTAGIEFIRQHKPDVLAVCGTSVLRPAVFSLAPKGAVNIHVGITPEYRSADPIFWTIYRGEPHNVGVTIHFIDRGIDTGPIIHQEQVPVYADDSLATIYARCKRCGAELYSRALCEIEDGSVRVLNRSDVAGLAFRSIDLGIMQYLLFLWRFRRMARSLPRAEVANTRSTTETQA